jgi:hypothetical protein
MNFSESLCCIFVIGSLVQLLVQAKKAAAAAAVVVVVVDWPAINHDSFAGGLDFLVRACDFVASTSDTWQSMYAIVD